MDEAKRKMLQLWRTRCRRGTVQHYRATHWFRFSDGMLTTTNVVSSISVLYLSAVAEGMDHHTHILIAVASVCTVITSVLQFILDYRTRWRAHERAGKCYGVLNRQIEDVLCLTTITDSVLSEVRKDIDRLSDAAPVMPWVFWNHPKHLTKEIRERESQTAVATQASQENVAKLRT